MGCKGLCRITTGFQGALTGIGVEDVAPYVKEYFKKSIEAVKGVNKWSGWKVAVSAEPVPSAELHDCNDIDPPPSSVGSQSSISSNESSTLCVESLASSVGSATSHFDAVATRYYLVGRPHFMAPGMVGRDTHGYVAYDPERDIFMFLKNAWRIDLPGIEKEGEMLALLNRKGVKFVPMLACHGDVSNNVRSASMRQFQPQRTVTQTFWKSPVGPVPRQPYVNACPLSPCRR
ncbi:uncharacterized protein FIBRA_08928 [Fibroporia radiculosa]|uniref:Uncharacterized protein n=1 Tax=Fibroporia radiculosa TaxID=599839 RepID=J4GXM8_9APHY|nr:uncharacterized protein FIBRA_08928 [Fibroporia radiculosa]CCM06645.1 predicted protein [Fibroporia radiculosa]